MNISLKAHHLVRYKQILALFFRYLLPAAGGLWLVLSIVIKDHKDKKRTRH